MLTGWAHSKARVDSETQESYLNYIPGEFSELFLKRNGCLPSVGPSGASCPVTQEAEGSQHSWATSNPAMRRPGAPAQLTEKQEMKAA